ncbi:carbohydrate ABC transporter permease, partial [Streptomyces sp. NPDC051453]
MTTAELSRSTLLRPRLLGRTTVNVVVAISVLYTMLPALWLVLAAGKSRDALFSSNILSFKDFSFVQNVKDLFAMDGGLYSRW